MAPRPRKKRVKADTGTPMKSWTKGANARVGEAWVRMILDRTRAGMAADGAAFEPYSESYAETHPGAPDLDETGAMLRGIVWRPRRYKGSNSVARKATKDPAFVIALPDDFEGKGRILKSGKPMAHYGYYVDALRAFLGLTEEDADKYLVPIVVEEFDKAIAEANKQRAGGMAGAGKGV